MANETLDEYLGKNEDGESFSVWLSKIDIILVRSIGLTHRDLPDKPYADYFEDGHEPLEAVKNLWGASLAQFENDWGTPPIEIIEHDPRECGPCADKLQAAHWDALEGVMGSQAECAKWMYMGTEWVDDERVWLIYNYKHIDTRRYLRLDRRGGAYNADGDRIPLHDAIAYARKHPCYAEWSRS